ncbi:MAG TPA: TIGR03621 family F420-dependent LLM class oxidoreductase [Dehalococcoidia bacterium]|nr:TIGR03621 family F420-dependent LLM class oxidoreductase [Dehalococcoidia bacterium]
MATKFRFGVQTSRGRTREEWTEKARKIESLGYSTLFMPDHFEDQLAPMPALMAAADATTTLRVGTLVLDNDYRHPLVLAKEAATLDLLSHGRLELGIGAGWMKTDYDASGIPFDQPAVRIRRFKEALRIIKGLLGPDPVDFKGEFYRVTNHNGLPKPVQSPLPILVGGGGRWVLSIAAREAQIVGVNFSLEQGAVNQKTLQTGSGAATDEKIAWIKEAAGSRFDELELNVTVFVTAITDDRMKFAERMAPAYGMTPQEVLDSPHSLVGSVEQIVDTLQERRARFGFSYVVFSGDNYEQWAPIVSKLAGT